MPEYWLGTMITFSINLMARKSIIIDERVTTG